MVLGYSRALAALFTLDQTLESFLRGHVDAFDALGGVARNLVYDNLRSAVLDRRGTAVQFHPRLLELAGHYHFAPHPCTPDAETRRGRSSARSNTCATPSSPLGPSATSTISTPSFRWRDVLLPTDAATPSCPYRTVADVWAEEQPRLLPLPAHPFETDLIRAVRSGKTPYVRFDAESLLDSPHPRPKAADPARRRYLHPHPRRPDRARSPPPHLRHRTHRRGPRPSRGSARRHPPGQCPHHPRPAPRRRSRNHRTLRAPRRARRTASPPRHQTARPTRRLRAPGTRRRRHHRPRT